MAKTKKQRRKERRKAAQAQAGIVGQRRAGGAPVAATAPTQEAERPTAQRLARGNWRMPTGMGKHDAPAVDTSADMIGQLHDAGQITGGQEQAARHWQALRARYVAELPDVATFKSCIAGSVPGYDDGDGDPVAIEEYRRVERRMTRQQRSEVLHVCEEGHKPRNLEWLRSALDVVSGKC